ncbi:MAG: 3-deoxy-7-phosphoheptulonate synthase [Verrucomicrobiota bacterium]
MQVLPVINTTDINIESFRELPTPEELLASIPKNEAQAAFVTEARDSIHRIIFGDDPHLLVIVGPCSIHDLEAGREYARRLVELAEELKDRLYIVMRVYFEKPRTTVGWKGLIMDPHLNGSYDIPEGLKIARNFLREVIDIGLPTATELLDPITPQYIADLICWTAIGARTTESQTHRQMASGLSMPLGFKNSTDGSIEAAINAIKAASQQQTFLGIAANGRASAVTTKGNPNCHLVLRGGKAGPNYSAEHVGDYAKLLESKGLIPAVMVDCAHDNSGKDPAKSPAILAEATQQILDGNNAMIGAMIESNINAGNQKFPQPLDELKYGVSITDPCLNWEDTQTALRETYEKLAPRFA